MKKSLLVFTALCLTMIVLAQNNPIVQMFEKYSERDGFSVVTISSKMFSLFANLDTNKEAENILPKLKSIRILSVEDSLLNKSLNFYTELSKNLDLTVYEELMVAKGGRDVTKFLIRSKGDRIVELLVVSGGPGGNSLISIEGDLSLKNISELSKSMNIQELEGIEAVDKKK